MQSPKRSGYTGSGNVKKKKKNVTLKKKEIKNNLLDMSVDNGGRSKSIHSNISSQSQKKKSCNYDLDVKRIFTPFNKFQTNPKPSSKGSMDSVSLHSAHYSAGLTSKEKSFIVCSCQKKTERYFALKELAAQAIKLQKIFTIYTHGTALRDALVERGWVEKLLPRRMTLTKIRQGKFPSNSDVHNELERLMLSNLVERQLPRFIWVMKEDQVDPKQVTENTILNKLKIDGLWTTKQGLCSSMRDPWFYIEDVAEVLGPRTYASDEAGEIEEFVSDFKVTACTSLLKWVLSMVANDKPVFLDCGKIGLNVIVFSLNRCKEFIFKKQNKDIDKKYTTSATPGQWNAFLKKYYRIIAKEDVFESDRQNKLPLYMVYAKLLLKEIYKIRPQLSCEGCHNIWIIKPSHNCRGRGIRMASKLGVITDLVRKANSKFVIQKYIEEPLLIHDTKFDIRQYYLITSTYPLVIWMYKDCYLKFSSQQYSLKDYHESIHLTNNAVQKKYTNCKGRHPELPKDNMWDSNTYKQYLIKNGKENVWDNVVYAGMKKSIVAILLACQDQLAYSKNRFELYGCDFILDKDYRPWLIEINSCPDLNPTTSVTAKICPEVLRDIVKVVIDRPHYNKSHTGKFECIYNQPMTMPRYGHAIDLYIKGKALPNDYFYRGKLQLQGSFEDCKRSGVKMRDINVMMNRLKHIFDNDIIMVEPDDNVDMQDCGVCRQRTTIGRRKSDELLGTKVITEKIDNCVNTESQISTDNSCDDFIELCLKSVRSFAAPPEGVLSHGHEFSKLDDGSSVSSSEHSPEASVPDATVKSESSLSETEPALEKDCLEDGSVETEPVLEAAGLEDRSLSSSLPEKLQEPNKVPETGTALETIRKATMKLFDFLEKKELEYKNSR